MLAKIEIGATAVDYVPGGYHTFILVTLSDGVTQYILRAGPEDDNPFWGDLYVVGADELMGYSEQNKDIIHDWDYTRDTEVENDILNAGKEFYYATQKTGTDEEIMDLFH